MPRLLRFICMNRAPSLRLGDRRDDPAILAAFALFDADDVGAVLGEQRRAIRSGDVAAEIENADAFQDAAHGLSSE